MRVIKLTGKVEPDHTLHLRLPEDVAASTAEVIVLLPDMGECEERSLDRFLDTLEQAEQPLTAEEVDRVLAAERTSWE